MKIGIGLPGDAPDELLDWGRRADAGPFSTLGLLDRLIWHNPEPLVTLAAIAATTSRIRLQTEVLIGPLRDTALLATQVATLDRIAGGRFTLGIGVGSRTDDFTAAGAPLEGRGRRLDEQLTALRQLWAGKLADCGIGPVGPAPLRPEGPEILFGAFAPAALARVARFGHGLLCAAPAPWAGDLFRAVEREWAELGRPGRPRNVGQLNVAFGSDETVAAAKAAISDCYAIVGASHWMVAGMLTTEESIRAGLRGFEELGADEVILYCWSPEVEQVDRLAGLVDRYAAATAVG
ncbi:LLM class flavin-dependent oxidoreductase [Amycolatopsis vastitatis]|uniref:LLM class flavin-dependent oxidoreductase n=1 Tax=Amycolatopsis vastitatis TaxID=1905142 RepID=A0A229T4I5_9PSEU|nr:LLM class flavin-dependent oxidoreductase [Amycolatopsis vastitatis]OXM65920.1 LLM class flavin-dependent oxidoreductase [Amycolatopsis vastitatis]